MTPLDQIKAHKEAENKATQEYWDLLLNPVRPVKQTTDYVHEIVKEIANEYAVSQTQAGLLVMITDTPDRIVSLDGLLCLPTEQPILPNGPFPISYREAFKYALIQQSQSDGAAIVAGNQLYLTDVTLIPQRAGRAFVPSQYGHRQGHATSFVNSAAWGDVIKLSEEEGAVRRFELGKVVDTYQPPQPVIVQEQPVLAPTGTEGDRGVMRFLQYATSLFI